MCIKGKRNKKKERKRANKEGKRGRSSYIANYIATVNIYYA